MSKAYPRPIRRDDLPKTTVQVNFIQKFDSVYETMRNIQAAHDLTEYRCIGSGICCQIGLLLHLSECEDIANNLKRQYWIIAERDGLEVAKPWLQGLIKKLTERLFDDSWDGRGGTNLKCAFWDDYCRIYEYRPMVCRAYSLIMPEDHRCPRKKQENGNVFIYHDDTVEATLDRYDTVISEWAAENPGLDYKVYYATGILRFLIKDSELEKLAVTTDERFWQGIPGNPHRMRKKDWDE